MNLEKFFTAGEISLHLQATRKDLVLREMVGLLPLGTDVARILYELLKKREQLGSTGVDNGVAIPHTRSLVVDRLWVAYGRKPDGLDFDAVDGKPVCHFFLIVAPPLEISNQYLPVLGAFAEFCKNPKNLQRLKKVRSKEEFLKVMKGGQS